MPRTLRRRSKTGIYHIMLRGVNKQCIFHDDEDRNIFLNRLARFKDECNFDVYAYCLMGNHVHLLIKEKCITSSTIMKKIGVSYVYWFNKKYDRTGHLFQGRYSSEPVENDKYFLTVARYIHQNPIKVGSNIKDWTSYTDYLQNSGLTDIWFLLDQLNDNRKIALDMFTQYMNEQNSDMCLDSFDKKRLLDRDAEIIIKEEGKIEFCQEIQQMDIGKRNKLLAILKNEGISIRQISRITGLNRSIILKA